MKVNTITTEITIKVPLEKTWEALYTYFGDVSLFNPNLSGSHLTNSTFGAVGSERECQIDKTNFIQERIIRVDPMKNFTIEVTGGKLPLVKTMQVDILLYHPDPGYTFVTTVARLTIRPTIMSFLMKGIYKSKLTDMLIGLKYFLETGKAVTKSSYHLVFQNYQLLEVTESFHDIQVPKNNLCSDCSICCHCQK